MFLISLTKKRSSVMRMSLLSSSLNFAANRGVGSEHGIQIFLNSRINIPLLVLGEARSVWRKYHRISSLAMLSDDNTSL